MPNLDATLDHIAARRASDPLAIVTVIAPSRLAALQLRRRLATRGAFAGVRFETVGRLAELVAAPSLAREHRSPLARPIADYVATRIARESLAPLHLVRDIPGYARALRQTFRRLRRGGFHDGNEVIQAGLAGAGPAEIARLYSRFRTETAAFYDDDDLLEAAARVMQAAPGTVLPELGDVYVVPPVRLSAASSTFLDAIAALSSSYSEVEEDAASPTEQRLILAPDAASEARAVVRAVIGDLEAGVTADRIAVFTSGDRAYRPLLRQVFAAAGVPDASMPGTPLIETPAGRGALALARLAQEDYSRVALFDFLGLAPLRGAVPTPAGNLQPRVSQWQRIAREAGVTHGLDRWLQGIAVFIDDKQDALRPEGEPSEWRRAAYERDVEAAGRLRAVVQALAAGLEPLRKKQPASSFIPPFRALIEAWFAPGAAGLEKVLGEVDQLGTIDAVGGSFDLASFVEAFEANLTLAALRDRPLGEGVLIADHRQAAGLRFDRVYLCGAYEGALPAITTSEPLVQEEDWARLRTSHPFVEDIELRSERSKEAVGRVAASAASRLTWSAPTSAATAAREYYPSAMMTGAARDLDDSIVSATALRQAAPGGRDWLTKTPSPLSALLAGAAVDPWELRLRESVRFKQAGAGGMHPAHPLRLPVDLIRARRGGRFSEFDGNLGALQGLAAPAPGRPLSPSSLEAFAGCGMRYFFGNVLYLRPVEEPEDSQTMGAAERGSLVHRVLQRFFEEQQRRGRPRLGERWGKADEARLIAIFEEEFERLRLLGRAGLDIYMGQDARLLRGDLVTFLEKDSDYRIEEGVIPASFEQRLAPTPAGDVLLHGFVDRIDRSEDGKRAFVFDYKTGRGDRFDVAAADPFKGGAMLQLPTYVLAASDAETVQAAYWFVSSAGGFDRKQYDNTPENRQRFDDTLRAILAAMQAGAFPAVPGDENDFYGKPEKCRYCDFHRICSTRRVYEHQQKSDDPDMVAWLDIAAVARGEKQL